jgi:flavin reductase (DIM6/NTAB) family NADH-FMN oxidoreductase RutF
MDEAAKKTAFRMIPYGLYVLTTVSKDGKDVGAATVNWITQSSFNPPLVVAGVKADSGAQQHIKDTGTFAINVLGKDQLDLAFNFFKSHERDGNSIGGQAFEPGPVTAPPCSPHARPGGSAGSWARFRMVTTPCSSARRSKPVSAPRTRLS